MWSESPILVTGTQAASAEWGSTSWRHFANATCRSARLVPQRRRAHQRAAKPRRRSRRRRSHRTKMLRVLSTTVGTVYFGMSVSASYLEATVIAAAVARQRSDLEVFVNISQMSFSQMSLTEMTDSPQQRQHWLGEQVLDWSGLPVVHVRATVFLQHPFFSAWAAESIARDSTIRLPFGTGRTSPVNAGCGRGDHDHFGQPNWSRRQGLRADRTAV